MAGPRTMAFQHKVVEVPVDVDLDREPERIAAANEAHDRPAAAVGHGS